MDTDDAVIRRYKLDVDAYHRMGEAGILGPKDRVELIRGELVEMAPTGDDHAGSVNSLAEILFLACAGKAYVSVQTPVRLDRYNEPQPDFGISRLRDDRYWTGRPGPADILLLIEVSDSSLRFDRTVKLPLYARTGVSEFWLVDLQHRTLEVYRRPEGAGFREAATYEPGDTVSPSLLPEVTIPVDRMFKPD